MNKEQFAIIATMCFLIALATGAFAYNVFGLLSKESPDIVLNGPPVNFSADQQDIDIQIDPSDPLPFNGTVSISTAGATDSDLNGFPPIGVSVIIQNDTVTVTKHTVDIATDLQDEAAEQATESDDD